MNQHERKSEKSKQNNESKKRRGKAQMSRSECWYRRIKFAPGEDLGMFVVIVVIGRF
jgi:hypothetical protein